jgi:plasmid stabilization system protein ParE
MYKLIFGVHFHDDVSSAVRYIRNTLKAPAAASRLKSEVKAAYQRLRDSPFSGPAVPNEYLASLGYRYTLVKNYMVFYTVDDVAKLVFLVRFMYGPRNWPAILTATTGRSVDRDQS